MKNELTIDNIVEYYNGLPDYTERLNDTVGLMKLCTELYKNMILYFYGTLTDNNIKKNPFEKYHGAFIKLNDDFKERLIFDVNRIEFTKMYSHIMCKLYERNKISFTPCELGDLYQFITYNYREIKDNERLVSHAKKIHHFLLHYTYSLGANPYLNNFTFSNFDLVVDYAKDTFQYIFGHYKNIIYIDTDSIYYVGDGKKICDYIDWLELPYTVDDTMVCFYKLKKYIELYNGEVKVRGLGGGRKRKYPPYAEDVDDIVSKMNVELRKRKINILMKNVL